MADADIREIKFALQCLRKEDGARWHTIALFSTADLAEQYLRDHGREQHLEYRVHEFGWVRLPEGGGA